jgi:hypothetical protein
MHNAVILETTSTAHYLSLTGGMDEKITQWDVSCPQQKLE